MNNLTDREFLDMMMEKYHIEDFEDAAIMCSNLSRFARISVEISEQFDNKYGKTHEQNMKDMSTKLNDFSDKFHRAYLDDIQ